MKIAIYTLTRDRLEYTQRSFQSLRGAAGMEYDHFVVDNGSEDGTPDWLHARSEYFKELILLDENAGISVASNLALDHIQAAGPYDLIFKVDNDCIFLDQKFLASFALIYERAGRHEFMLSPRVVGINKQPHRRTTTRRDGTLIGWVGQVGGLCHVAPAKRYQEFRYNEHLPMAWGQDENLCTWMRSMDVKIGYVENLVVEHCDTTNGQVQRYPAYFERKWVEEEL